MSTSRVTLMLMVTVFLFLSPMSPSAVANDKAGAHEAATSANRPLSRKNTDTVEAINAAVLHKAAPAEKPDDIEWRRTRAEASASRRGEFPPGSWTEDLLLPSENLQKFNQPSSAGDKIE
jgi:hypothetical protein